MLLSVLSVSLGVYFCVHARDVQSVGSGYCHRFDVAFVAERWVQRHKVAMSRMSTINIIMD